MLKTPSQPHSSQRSNDDDHYPRQSFADLSAIRAYAIFELVSKGVFEANQHERTENVFRRRSWTEHVFGNVSVFHGFNRVSNAGRHEV